MMFAVTTLFNFLFSFTRHKASCTMHFATVSDSNINSLQFTSCHFLKIEEKVLKFGKTELMHKIQNTIISSVRNTK